MAGHLIPVPVDKPALETLAGSTGGTAYTAASGDRLQHAYDDLGKQVGTETARRDQTAAMTGLALLLALGAAGASLAWFRMLPRPGRKEVTARTVRTLLFRGSQPRPTDGLGRPEQRRAAGGLDTQGEPA